MSPLPIGLLLAGTVAMGVNLARGYMRGDRRPMLNSVHLLLGAASIESLAVMQAGLPSESEGAGWSPGKMALGLVALALVLGLIAQLIRRQSTATVNRVLVLHASAGALGFVLFLVWATRL
jgi:hypothetical protein